MSNARYTVVAASLHDPSDVDRIVQPVRHELAAAGGEPCEDPAERPDLPHLIVVATGGTEAAILEAAAARSAVAPWEPVVLVAHRLHNSLPAALEAMARLRADGCTGRIVQSATGTGGIADVVADLAAVHRLRRSRLGLVGTPSEWLVASVPDATRVRGRWGIELVDVDIGSTIDRYEPAVEGARPVAVRFSGGAEPSRATLAAAALHPPLAEAIGEHGLDAVAVRCFDFLGRLETSGCVALAELNDTGVVAGCEGDVASTVAMMLVRALFDEPSWVANPAAIDRDANSLVLAHCTVAPSMVTELELHTHFESGLGVGLRGRFAPGRVTLLRLGGPELERHWFADAEVLRSGHSPDLCRTQVELRVDQDVGELLDDPLGNHLVMVRGRRRDRLEAWWRLAFGMPGAR